ncbi:hypothetical protein KA525_03980, partial [Candidatus Woesebacteria bacterium]|nr:hypothetical protein [Candidatus Woesebacteria bacterium]
VVIVNVYTMTHTQLDSEFLSKKHFVVHQITKELLEAIEGDLLSRDSSRLLATEVLEMKDAWKDVDDILTFLKKCSEDYPFLQKLNESFQKKIQEDRAALTLSKQDAQKLENIQQQLSKLSQE